MGGDGGSIPRRIELVRQKQKAERLDGSLKTVTEWFYCALSKKPLETPVVSCILGKLYNKEAILEYVLDPTSYGDADKICPHIKSLKDVTTLKLTPNPTLEGSLASNIAQADRNLPSSFVCPVTMKEMNGKHKFCYLLTCGCVLSEQALKEVPTSNCLVCNQEYSSEDVIVLNPKGEDLERQNLLLETRKKIKKEKKKDKKKRDTTAESSKHDTKKVKKVKINATSAPSFAPPVMSEASAILEKYAAPKVQLSDNVQSIFAKDEEKNKTKVNNMFFHGTYTRYAA
ncbi:Replication termination factor 2 [Basidiobolus ranarum]|uniref:Replication termination factor 2 n=1 Tax=Basidiobolus ranarum TaxID=34480 RepID=A0ABR2W6B2_9FUNG